MLFDYRKKIIKQFFAEFLGTGLIVFFGESCAVASKLMHLNLTEFEISLILGLGVSISIYFSISISGAHLNPAITIYLWLSSNFQKKKVIPYISAQILGSFCFTTLVYYLYYENFVMFEYTHNIIRGSEESLYLASIFCVYPRAIYNHSFIHDFIIELFIATIFMVILLQLNNKKNNFLLNSIMTPLLIGLVVTIMNITISPATNISLNPAKDLGSRVFLSLIGWGWMPFTGGKNGYFMYFIIPIIGPILGFILGGWMHKHIFNCKYIFKNL